MTDSGGYLIVKITPRNNVKCECKEVATWMVTGVDRIPGIMTALAERVYAKVDLLDNSGHVLGIGRIVCCDDHITSALIEAGVIE